MSDDDDESDSDDDDDDDDVDDEDVDDGDFIVTGSLRSNASSSDRFPSLMFSRFRLFDIMICKKNKMCH